MSVPALYLNDTNCYMFLNLQSEMVGVVRRAFYLVNKNADGIPLYELYEKEYSYFILACT